MNERDKELANQVTWYADVTLTELSRYADLVRADEREACAKVCEQQEEYGPLCETPEQCAAGIRARGNT